MPKITFIGAGSTVFAKNILGDCLLMPSLHDAHIALYDIDAARLEDSQRLISAINQSCNQGRATITAHLGVDQRKEALRGSDYAINAIQVGGYEPCTVTDFEVPKRFGLRQTIADTLGIGGIFRTLRTVPVLLDIAHEMEELCPGAWLLNYTNPMCMITSAILRGSQVPAVGLCHSVQGCAEHLLKHLSLDQRFPPAEVQWRISGINHQAWLLEITHQGQDIYPIIKQTAAERIARLRERGEPGAWVRSLLPRLGFDGPEPCYDIHSAAIKAHADGNFSTEELEDLAVAGDLVRLEMMFRFGYYITESSEHSAEYTPWFIKRTRPELIDHFNIPLDEYPLRCVRQIAGWARQREELLGQGASVEHRCTAEFGAGIINAMETDIPLRIAGNVMNTPGLIPNLPRKACVEVPCLVDRNGVQPCAVEELPEACAALNRSNINPQILTVEALLSGRKDYVYQAALLDPHTSAELAIDDTIALCDALFEAHAGWLPELR
ncbi:MAG: alpha-glucosidase/alpha-galactosidase [Planctomycetota bacterium]|nr:MAG: alpha-glucosidase/alpha-galactosidase [Planctomycetota bacterium]